MNKESKQNNDPDMLEEYDFSQGVRGKYYKRYSEQEMAKQNQIARELTIGAITTTVTGILNLFPALVPISIGIEAGFTTWQTLQLNKFQERVKQRLVALNKDKLDKDFLKSDEFISLVIQTAEAASKTASEVKQKALANILTNSVVLPTSKYKNKETLLRVLSQLSDEEIQALKIVYEEEASLLKAEKKALDEGYLKTLSVEDKDIAKQLRWSEEDARIACEGLFQLALVYNHNIGAVFDGKDTLYGYWRVTSLAQKLIEFSQNPATF